jgi:hypothetical protein
MSTGLVRTLRLGKNFSITVCWVPYPVAIPIKAPTVAATNAVTMTTQTQLRRVRVVTIRWGRGRGPGPQYPGGGKPGGGPLHPDDPGLGGAALGGAQVEATGGAGGAKKPSPGGFASYPSGGGGGTLDSGGVRNQLKRLVFRPGPADCCDTKLPLGR